MRTFELVQEGVTSAEGVEFSDGSVSLRWNTTDPASTCTHGAGFDTVTRYHPGEVVWTVPEVMDGGAP